LGAWADRHIVEARANVRPGDRTYLLARARIRTSAAPPRSINSLSWDDVVIIS
jgi:hypothetical protein